jgi:Zn-dependent protease with chaperone function
VSIGGVVGFGVVAVVLVTAFSLIATAWVALAAGRLRDAGPAAERSAAGWALLAPIVLAATIVVVIAAVGSGSEDHCVGHDHHAHFCFVHGAAWLERPWAVALAVASTVTFVLRIAAVAWRRARARRAITQVRKVSELGDGVWIARSERVFCFVAGWRRPEVFMSSRANEALPPNERAAVIAHERAHAAHGDLWLSTLVDLASTAAAPLAGGWLHTRWTEASERLCDTVAARATAPESVASALVRMCRAGHLEPIASGFTPAADALEDRVRAVLAGVPAGRRLGWIAWSLVAGAIAASVLLATPLHHALETLLG